MIITGTSSGDTLNGGSGDDTIITFTGSDVVSGGAGSDLLVVDYSSQSGNYAATNMQASVAGGGGYDGFIYDSGGNVVQFSGIERLSFTGGSKNDSVFGFDLSDTLDGGAGDDTIRGNDGDDVLSSSSGVDFVFGGVGDDLLTVDYSGSAGAVGSSAGSFTSDTNQVTYSEIERVSVTGGSFDDTLVGIDLSDSLNGGGGSDSIDGGLGSDFLTGGAGNDTYLVDVSSDVVTEASGGGIDLVNASSSYSLSDYVEKLTLSGTAGINATGNSLNNTLAGNSAANRLVGGTGADTMRGGTGDDTYVVDALADLVEEFGGGGIDVVNSSVSWVLASNLEQLTLSGTMALNATGNVLNNVLVGNTGANVINGGSGGDTMTGGAGNDTYSVDALADVVTELGGGGIDLVNSSVSLLLGNNLENLTLGGTTALTATGNILNNVLTGNVLGNTMNGGAGSDTMAGGGGDDTYQVDVSADVVTEASAAGVDLVNASASFVLSDNLEKLTLTGTAATSATGNALNNVLTGNAAANSLDGGVGSDSMTGGGGDDTYQVDVSADVVTEAGGGGVDLVRSSVSLALGDNLEKLALMGTSDINATGNTLNNALTGNAGANTLNGGVGSDSMTGGAGNDTYQVDASADVVTEAGGGGIDLVRSAASFTLGSNIESLTLTGTVAINGTGNLLSNVLTGNSGANTLDAVGGTSGFGQKDSLSGGMGADIFVLGTATARLYDDGIVASAGTGDYAQITDFGSSDRLYLKGTPQNYIVGQSPLVNVEGQGVFFDSDNSGTKTANDELIAIVNAASALNLNTQAIFTP